MHVHNEYKTINGSMARLSLDVFGGFERKLGAEEFVSWLDQQMGLAMATVAGEFSWRLGGLVLAAGAKPGESNHDETIEVTSDDDTTVKVRLELQLKVNLSRELKAGIAGPILATIRGLVVKNLGMAEELAKKRTTVCGLGGLGDMFGNIVFAVPLSGYDIPTNFEGRFERFVSGFVPEGFPDRSMWHSDPTPAFYSQWLGDGDKPPARLYNEKWGDIFDKMTPREG